MSKSDQNLAQQGETENLPKNVSFSEALAESGETVEELTGGKQKKTRAAKVKNDGEAPEIKTPRVRIAPGSKPSQVLAQHIGEGESLHAAMILEVGDKAGEENTKAISAKIDNLAKKIGEKAVNVLRNRNNPANLQVYTRIGIEKLVAAGTMTSKDLTDHYHTGAGGKSYTIGTARAQGNQLMTLLPALKIANATAKGTLEVNPNSAILAELYPKK